MEYARILFIKIFEKMRIEILIFMFSNFSNDKEEK